MDCLDEPLHLQILNCLSGSLARAPADPSTPSDVSVITDGLPSTSVPSDRSEEHEGWDELEVNYAISYTHYVASLPMTSPYLPQSLPKLKALLDTLISQHSQKPDSAPSTSSTRRDECAVNVPLAQLCEGLFKAIVWAGWASKSSGEDVGGVISHTLDGIAQLVKDQSLAVPLVLLNSLHVVLSSCPIPRLASAQLPSCISTLMAIASPANLVKLLQHNSAAGTPRSDYELSMLPALATPSSVVMLISEIANILLATALLPPAHPDQKPFSALFGSPEGVASVPAEQNRQMLDKAVSVAPDLFLSSSEAGVRALKEARENGTKWLAELQEPENIREASGRPDSLFRITGLVDEEVELTVTVLHLLNTLTLHETEPEAGHISMLKHLLSEESTATDPRILEAAFICTSILVRNHTSLATPMTHHTRRMFMTPLPAFEGEMASKGGNVPLAVLAGSKCLAICIEESANDDLISSTLYTLLNTLSHSGSSVAPGAMSIRSLAGFPRETVLKQTAEQHRLVACTAVEVVAHLAMEIGRDDIIHLSISLLLQRIRGVDLVIEATIVANLVPLALAGSNSDLVEVFRVFSQISRSSHPEDPRMASNAILAAQTKLARGLNTRLDSADGYLFELLTLFADKGTQTQMVAMAPAGFDTKDKEKLVQLRQDSEARVADMKAWLAALLIPISELLAHRGYHPERDASTETVALFRNFWFISVIFGISGEAGRKRLSEHEIHALGTIAEKTPALVVEGISDFVDSDLEYNSVLRKDFAVTIQSKQHAALAEHLTQTRSSSDIRNLTAAQTTLLLAIYDIEEARVTRNRPSTMLNYFCNESVNSSPLISCLGAIAQKILQVFLKQLRSQVVVHSVPPTVAEEVCKILVACTHRYRKVREVAMSYARSIIETFAALMCDPQVVFTLLEILTLMRRACELQYTDEYSPVYEFKSDKVDITLQLSDDYGVRNEITTQLHTVSKQWLTLAISRAPIEVQSILQQYLNESRDVLLIDNVEMGAGLALHFSTAISTVDRQETLMPNIGGWPADSSNLVASQFATKNYFSGELAGARLVIQKGLSNLETNAPTESTLAEQAAFKKQMAEAVRNIRNKAHPLSVPEIRRLLLRASSVLSSSTTLDMDIVHCLVALPMASFTPLSIAAGVDAWTWLLRQRPGADVALIGEIAAGWLETIEQGKGLFSTSMNYKDPFESPVAYSPSDKQIMDLELVKAKRLLKPHLLLIQVLSSLFQAEKYRSPGIMIILFRLMMRSLATANKMSTHPLAREARFSLLLFGFQILASSRMETLLELKFRDRLYSAAFAWFTVRPQWSFGSDRIQVGAEIKLLQDFIATINEDHIRGDHSTSSMHDRTPAILVRGSTSLTDYISQHRERVKILQLLVESEISRLDVWCNPTNEANRTVHPGNLEQTISVDEWSRLIRRAWTASPVMAVHMGERFKSPHVQNEITRLVRSDPKAVVDVPEALGYLLGERLESSATSLLKWLPVWAAVPPVTALVFFQPRYGNNPLLLQYAMRVLEQHPVALTFFFVPQVVQALRVDYLGYVERFIFETSKISQLFCHQIIWNMKANTFTDDDASQPDPMKPLLDRMIDLIVDSLSGKARDFYDLEFTFFDAVTSISGKLKPYIKKTKPEKKAKIDEEMAKIKLSVGVYLPSNPDGIVVDLDRKSGRPLQSHAKAPFMATFKVQKERLHVAPSGPGGTADTGDEERLEKEKYEVWQSAIFKVGDDCRQDVLALQIIAMFKNIFTQVGLVLYLFPYRVTATAPGCGVIDVVPNATSRDEMGRAKTNDLYGYFVNKYGGVDTVPFQKARLNFIQSMAAYSVACYILQIKDRHNGNIMIDGEGHIVHIDFGFLFDIGPGGVKFEPNSFKLNREMVTLMGGRDSQGYRMFTELTVKAFLAIRPHANQLVDACHLMLGTGLPSFKGEGTIRRLRDRFQLQLGERAAAEYMMGVIRNAHENMRSNVYDGFQKMQNGIPY